VASVGFYSVWPYFLVMLAIFILACTPLLKWADLPLTNAPARVQTVDGLRGFLALGVFFHHTSIYHQYLLSGQWVLPPARFYVNLGQVGVTMFFMITGYLFWTQMLKVEGKPNLLKLFVGRAFRIIPLYLFLAITVLVTAGVMTDWTLRSPPLKFLKELIKWLSGGLVLGTDINGFKGGIVSAGVTWSLQYEWLFYASLIGTSLLARRRVLGLIFPAAALIALAILLVVIPNRILVFCLMFLVGMTTASAKQIISVDTLKIPQWVQSAAVISCLSIALFGFDNTYNVPSVLILGIAFFLIVSGTTVFGLLTTRPAKRLGDISYGIYLLQGPVLFLIFKVPFAQTLATKSPLGHWLIVMIAGVILILFATAIHGLIERPGVKAGHMAWNRLEPNLKAS
jgi:peptidoglycan/LPS O-acetylase OafA/YrhL